VLPQAVHFEGTQLLLVISCKAEFKLALSVMGARIAGSATIGLHVGEEG
jgi:hypothetical protein